MRAVQVVRLEGPQAVELVTAEAPQLVEGQVLIDVKAAGVTYPDVLLSRGEYQIKPEPPFTPGSEVAGVVVQAPAGSGFVSGQRVAAFPGFGGFAEQVATDPSMVFALPDRLSFAQGAGLPMNLLTVHFALTRRGGLKAGETVLVHGAAGGVGTAAVQLASVLGARVVAVVSSEAKADVARAAGADEVVLAEGFLGAVKELTGGRGVDIVVDPVGGDRFTDSLRSLAPEGRLLVIGFTGGEIPTVKVNRLLLNNIDVRGVGWGAYWLPRTAYLREQWTELLPHLETGRLDPVLGPTYPLKDAAEALLALDERRAAGKIVLELE
ncbi:NADPH:quinone oxidoreductase family protein [Streptomyces sp. NA04227]|uniref:NADPH:quinone oxidoreductase family protein n=1 Tax=Streptomyces sp. NA04227 TaxID=2742136 RepID=UPI00159055B6|nr:NADPH:quinone oxidoreductase family protein [Streptomyces sp. NA04227]QKW10516.1 NADPH:quinone oxidoreductase family protein [Streptomyces sp. NA04227]